MSDCNVCINNEPIPNPTPRYKFDTLMDHCQVLDRLVRLEDNPPCNCEHYIENKALVELLYSLRVLPPLELWHDGSSISQPSVGW